MRRRTMLMLGLVVACVAAAGVVDRPLRLGLRAGRHGRRPAGRHDAVVAVRRLPQPRPERREGLRPRRGRRARRPRGHAHADRGRLRPGRLLRLQRALHRGREPLPAALQGHDPGRAPDAGALVPRPGPAEPRPRLVGRALRRHHHVRERPLLRRDRRVLDPRDDRGHGDRPEGHRQPRGPRGSPGTARPWTRWTTTSGASRSRRTTTPSTPRSRPAGRPTSSAARCAGSASRCCTRTSSAPRLARRHARRLQEARRRPAACGTSPCSIWRRCEETPLAEDAPIDDQVEWLDDATIIYRDGESVFQVPADGSGAPTELVPGADSPSVVRPDL